MYWLSTENQFKNAGSMASGVGLGRTDLNLVSSSRCS